MKASFANQIIIERLLRAKGELLFASRDRQVEITEGLRHMEPGDIRVGQAAKKMLQAISKDKDPLPIIDTLLSEIPGSQKDSTKK